MGSSSQRKLRGSEVPPVLFASVSRKALRRAVESGFVTRMSGKPLTLYARRRQARRQGGESRVLLRFACRLAVKAGTALFATQDGNYSAETMPIRFASCSKLPDSLHGLLRVDGAGGIVVTRGKRPRVLLLTKREGRAKRWVLPKGKRQRSEARRRTARREVLEESGLSRVDVGPFLVREHYFDEDDGRVVFKEVSYFLMRCPKGKTRIAVNRDEGFTDGQWMSFRAAFEATNPVRAHRSLRKARAAVRSR